MTSGDIQAYIAVILALLVTLWGAIVTIALLFTEKTTRAAMLIEQQPGRCIGIGLIPAVAGIVLGVTLLNRGPLGLLGWVMLAGVLLLASVGSAGLARVVAARAQAMSPTQSPLLGLARGAGLLVLSGALPGLGWFLLFPLQVFASVGAGIQAVWWKKGPQIIAERQTQVQVQGQ